MVSTADAQVRAGRRGPRSADAPRLWLAAVALVVAAVFAAPMGYLLLRNLADPAALWRQLTESRTVGPLARSLLLATAVASSTVVVGTLAAWLAVRTDLPLRRVWRVVLPLPMVIPSFIGAFSLLAAFAPGGLIAAPLAGIGIRLPRFDGFYAAFFVLTLLTYPYVYLPVAARLRQLSRSVEEAARLFGRTPVQVFATIVLPQAAPAVLAGSLLVFLYTISDFGAVQILRYDTITRSIFANKLFDRQASLALSLELGFLALVVVATERFATRGPRRVEQPSSGVPMMLELRAWRAPAAAGVATLVVLSLVAPLGVLGFWAVRGLFGGPLRSGEIVANAGALVVPALHTATVSVVAAVVTVLAVAPVAFLTVRYRSRAGGIANAIVVGGFALPGVPLALALAFWTVRAPGPLGSLYQTRTLLVIAYVVNFGALALRAAQVAVAGVPRRMDEAARALGARRVRRLLTIELPLMAPGLAAAGGLVLLSAMKELPATLLLAPAGFQTLATKIWNAAEDAFLADASLASLVLVALSGVLTWLLVLRRDRTTV